MSTYEFRCIGILILKSLLDTLARLRVMDWFCQGLINLLMHGDTIYFVGRCVVEEADAPSPTVHLSSTILGGRGTLCTKRGQSALGQSVPQGHPALGQTVWGDILS